MSYQKKLYISVPLILIFIFSLGGGSIYLRQVTTTKAIEAQQRIGRELFLISSIQIHFKKQVQEWKNILLRGHNADDYTKYLSYFNTEEMQVNNNVKLLISQIDPYSQSALLAHDFLKIHLSLGTQYRYALATYLNAQQHNPIATDTAVRGIDRAPATLLDKLALTLENKGRFEVQNIQASLNQVLWIILALVLLSMLISCWLVIGLTKKIIMELTIDPTSGLKNNSELCKHIERSIKNPNHIYMLHIDLDQFKLINEVCGHLGGDEFLRQIGQVISGQVNSHDLIFRSNADEFVVLSDCLDLNCALNLAETVRKKVEQFEFKWHKSHFSTSCSIALVEINNSYQNIESVFTCSDLAIQEAKESGRNRVLLYSPINQGIAIRQQQMRAVHEVNQALSENSFELYKQRIEPLAQSSLKAYYEVLIRLKNPDGTISLPSTFLPSAEKYNIMDKIDRWVIKALCRYLSDNPSDENHYSVNLSGATLSDVSFIGFIQNTFANVNFNCQRIGFEITETEAVKNLEVTNKIIAALKQRHCKIALDDFGTGVSSLGYLINLNIDTIKIDGSFIKNLLHSETNQAIVRSVLDIAQTMNITTVAEFVENQETQDKLTQMGINYGQGFGLHKPEPLQSEKQLSPALAEEPNALVQRLGYLNQC
jgi:diguanylate cyclase (GGDEF)-like protein